MASFQESMEIYRKQLSKGDIQVAYRGLMDYFGRLRAYLANKYPEHTLSNIYYGYMDMTYFSFSSTTLKAKKLKIAIVFLHEEFRFEVWLSGANRNVQAAYWQTIKDQAWTKYELTPDPRKDDCVISHILVGDPDFSDLDLLTTEIEKGTLAFIRDVEGFLRRISD